MRQNKSTRAPYHHLNVFPYGTPYETQRDGMQTVTKTGEENGFTVIEGACGTGKTLLALSAGIELVRSPDTDYKRIFVATNVKQQLAAFESDLIEINKAARDDRSPIAPVTGVSLVGKADVCPYTQAGSFSEGEVYDRCSPLRDRTRDIIDGRTAKEDNPVIEALNLVSYANREAHTEMELNDATAPFSTAPIEYEDKTFCPFYAQYRADDIADEPSIPTETRLLTRRRLMEDAVAYGTCPHTTMRDAMLSAEVIFGNYQHVFAPGIVDSFTDPVLDEETFLIVDEAHGLIREVRDTLSENTTHTTFSEAISECNTILDWVARSTGPKAEIASAILNDSKYTRTDIAQFQTIIKEFESEIRSRAQAHLEKHLPEQSAPYYPPSKASIPLRPPDRPQIDAISTEIIDKGVPESVWKTARDVGEVIADIKSTVKQRVEDKIGEGTKYAKSAGSLITSFYEADTNQYFPEIRLVDRGTTNRDLPAWKQRLKAELWLNNLIPSGQLANRFESVGGGVLMSATLAPVDVYANESGLDYLTDRPSETAIYGLQFPPENRQSLAVDLPKFTFSNRAHPEKSLSELDMDTSEMSASQIEETRSQYREAIETVSRTTPGNVLICMPSYLEAQWIGTYLEDILDKPVLIDQSSSNVETTELKEQFFEGAPKVLATGLRATLTEGVDYAGDRLDAAVIAGVPIAGSNTPRGKAIKHAYEDRYGDGVGFRYGFTVPAVRKTRQALGRVIRNTDDVGTRVLLDERYTNISTSRNNVRSIFPDEAINEFENIQLADLDAAVKTFWQDR